MAWAVMLWDWAPRAFHPAATCVCPSTQRNERALCAALLLLMCPSLACVWRQLYFLCSVNVAAHPPCSLLPLLLLLLLVLPAPAGARVVKGSCVYQLCYVVDVRPACHSLQQDLSWQLWAGVADAMHKKDLGCCQDALAVLMTAHGCRMYCWGLGGTAG